MAARGVRLVPAMEQMAVELDFDAGLVTGGVDRTRANITRPFSMFEGIPVPRCSCYVSCFTD